MELSKAIAASADIQCDNLEQRDKIVAWLNDERCMTELRRRRHPNGLLISFFGFDEYMIKASLADTDGFALIPAQQFLTSNNI